MYSSRVKTANLFSYLGFYRKLDPTWCEKFNWEGTAFFPISLQVVGASSTMRGQEVQKGAQWAVGTTLVKWTRVLVIPEREGADVEKIQLVELVGS